MEKKSVREKTLKIALIYLALGCTWILLSDFMLEFQTINHSQELYYSLIKGFIYVFITSIFIFALTYPALKKASVATATLKKANQDLKESNQLFKELYQDYNKKQALLKSLINSVPDLIFFKDTKGVYLGCNTAFESFVGKPEYQIIGCADADIFPPEEAKLFRSNDAECMETKTNIKNEGCVMNPDGTRLVFEILKTPHFDVDGQVIGVIGISRDITTHIEREETIEQLSYHDVLTALYNRTYFRKARIKLDAPEYLPLSVIVGDVNGMKLVNDAFGHGEGDKLLKEIAGILMQCSRKGDVVARTGGDEFVILLPNTDNQTAKLVYERMRALCDKKRQESNGLYTGIALGYATKNEMSESLEKTLIMAEDLLYRRKLLENKSLHHDLLSSIRITMHEKSNETQEHAERLAELSKKLGKEMGLPGEKMDELQLVSMLHDLGKISVDNNILIKTEKLSEDDWREIKKHPEIGYRIASAIPELNHVAQYILYHHERWDGGGYPTGISGTDIPMISRIIAVVDAFDAMTQDRTYRKALTTEMAVQEILNHAGTQFDPEIAELFVNKVIQLQQ